MSRSREHPTIQHRMAQAHANEVVSEFRFVCSCGLHKNDSRNHTKSQQQSRFVWLRGSLSIASRPLKIRKLRHSGDSFADAYRFGRTPHVGDGGSFVARSTGWSFSMRIASVTARSS